MPGKVVTPEEWLEARKALLVKEKEATRAMSKINDELRDFPMVKVEKNYVFHAADGSDVTLVDLFKGKKQLIVYHFMLGPDDEAGCTGCSFLAEHFPDTRHLGTKDTAFCAVSRGPIDKISAYKTKTGWKFPWVSSNGSDFNFDFHVTLDESVAPVEYNYKNKDEILQSGQKFLKGEMPGMSVFFRDGDAIYHTYSTYARGLDRFLNTFNLLDITPLGRQVDAMGPGGFKRNYEYDEDDE